MRNAWWRSLAVFVGSSLCLAAGAPVAVRVEVEPLRAVDDETLVEVVVQVAPEDRGRIGNNAMVRLELDGGTPDGVSPLWAVKVAGDGTARIEVPWPPGEHDLRVEIMSPSGQDSGIWVGRVRIPRMPVGGGTMLKGPPGKETPLDEPSPTEARTPVPSATPDMVVAGRAQAVATALPSKTAPSPPAKPEPSVVAQRAGSATETVPPTPPPPTATAAETVQPAPPSPEATETPIPTAVPTTVVPAAVVPPTPTPTSPVVEPLRGKALSPTPLPVVEPLRGEAPSPPPAATEPAAPPAVDRAALEAWAAADPGTRDLTVVVTRAGEPVQDLAASDLQLEVEGEPVTIESVGNSLSAPLLLGVALDLSPERTSEFETIRRYLAPLTERAKDGRGRLFGTATGGGGGDDGEDAPPLVKALRAGGAGNLSQLIASSLPLFKGQRARTFLIVLTDGRGPEPTKGEWKEAYDAAAAAGVPILAMALWDSDFPQRVRRNLQQVAGVSGGQLFLVQGLDQMGSAVDRYGRALDAGVALRFHPPTAAKAGLLKIDVQTTEEGLEVRSAETINAAN